MSAQATTDRCYWNDEIQVYWKWENGEDADYVDQSVEHAFVRTWHSVSEELVWRCDENLLQQAVGGNHLKNHCAFQSLLVRQQLPIILPMLFKAPVVEWACHSRCLTSVKHA
jgi:hypothetical protein